MARYTPTIGLEIHAQLKTKTKLFCDSLNDPFETHPNVNICPVCMGHPGTLPVTNKKAVEHVVRVGFALNSEVARESKFDRKNYFYPDLPKGYQISQYDIPFCSGGHIDVPVKGEHGENFKRVDIERVHLEEDTGRLVHDDEGNSLVDFNRAGVPLMELVTKPVIENAEQARKFAQELRAILRYLDASDADMEKGQMRVEVNISLAKEGSKELGTKVELKNLNSLRTVEDATAYEVERQSKLLDEGEAVVQETRGWDENKQKTFSQRSKEEAQDYRYFPEPDLPPVRLTKEYGFDLQKIETSLPELPQAKRARLRKQYNLSEEDVEVLVDDPELANYYEAAVSEAHNWANEQGRDDEKTLAKLTQLTTNYIIKNLRTLMQDAQASVANVRITRENFGELMWLVHSGELSSSGARTVLEVMFETGDDPSNIMEKEGLKQVSDMGEIEKIVDEVIAQNEKAANDYKGGEENALKFLVGQVMKESRGAANPQMAAELIREKLK